ncbi:MAG: YHYH protein [Thalassotalea sp.]
MKSQPNTTLICLLISLGLAGCGGSSSTVNDSTNTSDNTDITDTSSTGSLHTAYSEFDNSNVEIVLNGANVIIETNGLPNHTSPYWSSTNSRSTNGHTTAAASVNHELFVEPSVTSFEKMAPGNIDDFNGTYTLTVANSPSKATTSSATGLGAIGIAVSGSVIYNDEEGPGIPLDGAASSLDFNGAHTGPQSFHYHLEPISFSDDDSNLVGVIADGFFLYGRKCNSTGDYPADLDASGGHTAMTQHSIDAEYHYHIQNELYLNAYYILFPGNYQGSASAIN